MVSVLKLVGDYPQVAMAVSARRDDWVEHPPSFAPAVSDVFVRFMNGLPPAQDVRHVGHHGAPLTRWRVMHWLGGIILGVFIDK